MRSSSFGLLLLKNCEPESVEGEAAPTISGLAFTNLGACVGILCLLHARSFFQLSPTQTILASRILS